jgi:hypothetical protein
MPERVFRVVRNGSNAYEATINADDKVVLKDDAVTITTPEDEQKDDKVRRAFVDALTPDNYRARPDTAGTDDGEPLSKGGAKKAAPSKKKATK